MSQSPSPSKPKLSLNCVGGGSKGVIVGGMLKAVHELGIKPDMVFGCSSGALNAALYIQGDIDLLEHVWMTISNDDVRKLDLFKLFSASLFDYSPLLKLLRRNIKPAKLRTGIPFYVACTSLVEDASVHFDLNSAGIRASVHTQTTPQGFPVFAQLNDPIEILWASATIPVLVAPVRGEYLDGGITDNYSIQSAIDKGATQIIALHPGKPVAKPIKNMVDAASILFSLPEWSIYIKQREAARHELGNGGLIEVFGNPGQLQLFDFDYKGYDRKSLFKQGYDQAKKVLG